MDELDVFIGVDNQRSFSNSESLVSEFSFSGSEALGVGDFLDIFVHGESLEESNGFLGLFVRFKLVFNNEGEFGNLFTFVSSGHHEGGNSRSGKSGGNSVSLLVDIDFSMPSSPHLKGSEHSTLSTHITESGLSSSVGSGSRNSGNTGDGTSGTPRFGGVLHTGVLGDSVGLSGILRKIFVDEGHDIKSDGGGQDSGEADL